MPISVSEKRLLNFSTHSWVRSKTGSWNLMPYLLSGYGLLWLIQRDVVKGNLNSLWPSEAVWNHRSWSTLFQAMACCLTAPSHHLHKWGPTISQVIWHSPDDNFTKKMLKIYIYIISIFIIMYLVIICKNLLWHIPSFVVIISFTLGMHSCCSLSFAISSLHA